LACCKLGEEIINNLIEIYQANANEDKMKARLVEFFLLQVAIHNPKGVKENHPAAYAVSWNTWKRCLNNLHNILIDEIEINMQLTVKNQSFFIVKDDIKQLFDGFVCLFVKVCRQLFDGDVSFADTSERPSKRARVEMGIDNLIDKLKTSKSWTW
jgi:ataxia telangiectasia mutated family protein